MSIGAIGISANWILELKFEEKHARIKQLRRGPIVLSFTFILYAIWATQANNFDLAIKDLLIKLPLLSMPIVIGTSKYFNKKELRTLLIAFFTGLLLSSIISALIFFDLIPPKEKTGDFRELSRTMHHIRYSLLISISVSIALFLILYRNVKEKKWLSILICWLIVVLIFIPSITGATALIIGISILLAFTKKSYEKANLYIGYIWYFTLVIIGVYFSFTIYDFYQVKDKNDLSNLNESSVQGEKYIHDINNPILENGNYVYINIAEKECRKSWNSRSKCHFDSTDNKGQKLKFTLYRYLTSKGLKKDSLGLSSLTNQDIFNIENGITSVKKYNAIEGRIREVLLEIQLFLGQGQANHHSVSQRIVFFKAGLLAFNKNFWLGVGTGGVKKEIFNQYDQIAQDFDEETKKKGVHNQFIALLITFGLPGAILFLSALIYPAFFVQKDIKPLYIAFCFIIITGFISDDMLDRQAGVTIFITLNSIMLFAIKKNDQSVLGSSNV